MHQGDLWQEYQANGERVMNGGRPSKLGNPKFPTYYGSVVTFLYRRVSDGFELLFQRRSSEIDQFGGYWDVSAGGHIDYDESQLDAAVREAKEEIGVDITAKNLRYGFSYCRRNMIAHVYFCDWTGRPDSFTYADGEVDAVKWVSLDQIDSFCQEFCKPPLKDDNLWIFLAKDWLDRYANHSH